MSLKHAKTPDKIDGGIRGQIKRLRDDIAKLTAEAKNLQDEAKTAQTENKTADAEAKLKEAVAKSKKRTINWLKQNKKKAKLGKGPYHVAICWVKNYGEGKVMHMSLGHTKRCGGKRNVSTIAARWASSGS